MGSGLLAQSLRYINWRWSQNSVRHVRVTWFLVYDKSFSAGISVRDYKSLRLVVMNPGWQTDRRIDIQTPSDTLCRIRSAELERTTTSHHCWRSKTIHQSTRRTISAVHYAFIDAFSQQRVAVSANIGALLTVDVIVAVVNLPLNFENKYIRIKQNPAKIAMLVVKCIVFLLTQ